MLGGVYLREDVVPLWFCLVDDFFPDGAATLGLSVDVGLEALPVFNELGGVDLGGGGTS